MKKLPKFELYFITLAGIVPSYLFFKYPFSLGGSLAICFFILALVPLLFQLRELSSVFVMLSIVLFGILVMNFLSYLENAKAITVPYIVIFGLLTLLITAFFYWTICWPLELLETLNDAENKILNQIQRIVLAPSIFIGLAFVTFSSLMILFIRDADRYLYNNASYLRGFYISFAGIVFCFLISFIYLRKISDQDIRKLISEDKSKLIPFDARKFRKWFLIIFCWFVINGSLLEIGRNMWPIWIETILLVGIMSMILWKIYKHVFQKESKMT